MNPYRLLVVLLFLLWLGAANPIFSQEAVETAATPITAEPTPIESPAAAKKRESVPEEEPAKKKEDAKPTKTIEMMSPEEFKAAGLDKLSPEELKNLNASLKGYRRNVETKAEKATAEATKKTVEAERKTAEAEKKARSRVTMDRIDSRVDGTITRLTGHSIIRLEDGTMWKQARSEDRFRAQVIDHPTASVEHVVFGYKMRIAGLPEFYVDPVRK
jgi:hypothetical protein